MAGRADPAGRAPSIGRKRRFARLVLAILASLLIALFSGLGTWQLQRLQWKLDLIERVTSRVRAAPVAAPPAADWPRVTRDNAEYRHVRLSGFFLHDVTTPVQAVSELGAGFWLLTPLCTVDGAIVLVNRGFVPAAGARARYPARKAGADACAPGAPGRAVHTLTGLLRISEPGGGFLRENDPAGHRWFSRDVAAIASARGLTPVAPYFVDAARGQDPAGVPDRPVGGLTVVSFQNNHLVYAVTWYALALMVIGAWWYVVRSGRRGANGARDNGSKA